jgi:hypothetical protein
MKLKMFLLLGLSAGILLSCQKENDFIAEENALIANDDSTLKGAKSKNSGFVHGIEINIDGEMYYFAGPPDGDNGELDVPGHFWVQSGKDRVVGKHYNTGPFGMSKWWSSDAEDGALLYIVSGIIDTWSVEKADYYKSRGYVHRHEFVRVVDEELEYHPSKVVWLKHTSRTSFTLDGGPGAPNPPYEHYATPGVDLKFPNNGFMPYPED